MGLAKTDLTSFLILSSVMLDSKRIFPINPFLAIETLLLLALGIEIRLPLDLGKHNIPVIAQKLHMLSRWPSASILLQKA